MLKCKKELQLGTPFQQIADETSLRVKRPYLHATRSRAFYATRCGFAFGPLAGRHGGGRVLSRAHR